MRKIYVEEMLQILESYHFYLHCDKYFMDYYFADDISFTCYAINGCILTVEKPTIEDKYYHYTIHQASDYCTFDGIIKYVVKEARTHQFADVLFTISDEGYNDGSEFEEYYNKYYGSETLLHKPVIEKVSDVGIRELKIKDLEILDDFFEKHNPEKNLPGETKFGMVETSILDTWIDYAVDIEDKEAFLPGVMQREGMSERLFGLFIEGELVGTVIVNYYEDFKLASISNIYVCPDKRQKGYGKRLVNFALSVYPDVKYYYCCAKDNYDSEDLASSCGFESAGAAIYLYSSDDPENLI